MCLHPAGKHTIHSQGMQATRTDQRFCGRIPAGKGVISKPFQGPVGSDDLDSFFFVDRKTTRIKLCIILDVRTPADYRELTDLADFFIEN
jgi:hypothetical protein